MDISAALAADLASLTDALDDPDIDLTDLLSQVDRDASLAVGSYLGLSVTLTVNDAPLTLTAFDPAVDPAHVASSVLVPLPGGPTGPGDSDALRVVFYAATPGAFVDFAADLCFALGLPLTACPIDEHLTPEIPSVGSTDLAQLTLINQAIGVLLERGHTPSTAQAELHRLADLDSGHLHHAAAAVIATIARKTAE